MSAPTSASDLGGQRVDRGAGVGAGGVHVDPVTGGLAHQPGSHLGLAAVADADEQHRRRAHRVGSCRRWRRRARRAAPRTRASISSRIGRTASTPLPAGSVSCPVEVALAGEDRAGVAAAHGDDDVGGLDGVGGEQLGTLGGDVDADLGHGLADGRVDRSAGADPAERTSTAAGGVVVEEGGGHLGAAGVVHADEQHRRGGCHQGTPVFGLKRQRSRTYPPATPNEGNAHMRDDVSATGGPPRTRLRRSYTLFQLGVVTRILGVVKPLESRTIGRPARWRPPLTGCSRFSVRLRGQHGPDRIRRRPRTGTPPTQHVR